MPGQARPDLPAGPALVQAVDVIRSRLATATARRALEDAGSPAAAALDARIATLRKAEELLARQAVALGDSSALARWPAPELRSVRGLSQLERTDVGSLVADRQIRGLRSRL